MFYRVLCITLLALACTFTLILTNVFVDIDLLLASKDNSKTEPAPTKIENFVENKEIQVVENKQEPTAYEGDSSSGDEEEERWRKKRSIESASKDKKNPRHAKLSETIEPKRFKRHIKVRYTNNEKDDIEQYKEKKHNKKNRLDDDELYVEIKTHFSSKRVDGAKKKKLIAMLIDKIEQALHSDLEDYDMDIQNQQSKPSNPWNVETRVQNTIEALRKVPHKSRLLDTIDKIDDLERIKMKIPVINIMKEGETDVQENTINQYTYVPERYLAPLTTSDRDFFVTNALFELRNKLMKNLAETAASIGLGNEDGPDIKHLKIINAVNNLIRTYHERLFRQRLESNDFLNHEINQFSNYNDNHISKRDVQKNKNIDIFSVIKSNMIRRKIIPKWETKVLIPKQRRDGKERGINLFSQDMLTKSYKPADLFTLASLLDRAKRSAPKRLSKKTKNTISTNPRSHRYFVKTYDELKDFSEEIKRNKRNIMYNLDSEQAKPDEDDFFMDFDQKSTNRNTNNLMKHFYNVGNSQVDSRFSIPFSQDIIIKARQNGIMTQYPHIFFGAKSRQESYVPENFPSIEVPESKFARPTTEHFLKYLPSDVKELIKAMANSTNSDSNIRVSLKSSDPNMTRYKEVHTSLGEKYDHNDLSITSQSNVSQISPIIHNLNELHPNSSQPNAKTQTSPKPITNETEIIRSELRKLNIERIKINQLLLRARENKRMSPKIKMSRGERKIKYKSTTEKTKQSDLINVSLTSNTTTKILAMSREEVSKIVTSVLNVLKAVPNIVNSHLEMPISNLTTKIEHNTPSPTNQSLHNSTYENHLRKIINLNLELTNQVIKKIDKNTDMLGVFLRRLSKKIENYEKNKLKKLTHEEHKTTLDDKIG